MLAPTAPGGLGTGEARPRDRASPAFLRPALARSSLPPGLFPSVSASISLGSLADTPSRLILYQFLSRFLGPMRFDPVRAYPGTSGLFIADLHSDTDDQDRLHTDTLGILWER